MKIFTIFAILIVLAAPAAAVNVTKFEIRGVVFDQKSPVYNTTLVWDAQNFTGFYYNFNGGKSGEFLNITNQQASSLKSTSRTISKENLYYNTSRLDQNYTIYTDKGWTTVESGLTYSSSTNSFTKGTTGNKYAQLGWFGDRYVALNGKSNKLARLIKEQKKEEKQTLKLGTPWDLGEGYVLTVESIDTTTSPRQAWLNFSKDGKVLDNKVVKQNDTYTYTEKNLKGESDVPVFTTYVEGIFTGAEGMSALVQFRYTWLISQNVLEVKVGDKFGVFEVKEAKENYLSLYNKDTPIDFSQNTVQTLYGDLKFKVADSSTALRFYPILEKSAPGKYELRGGAYDQTLYKNLIWDAQRFPGFYYNFNGGKSGEFLNITNQQASSLTSTSRTISKENLYYNTSRLDQNYTIYTDKGWTTVENGLTYSSSTNSFTKGTTGNKYAQLGWFGDRYVALNGKSNKLAKLIKEQKKEEKQTLKLGTPWDLGEGYVLTVESIDTTTSPRQAWLNFSKDGKVLDNKVVKQNDTYTYTVKNLKGESDVPVFTTYVEGIFTGAEGMSALVQFRYTWLISQNVLEVKVGDKFGVFEVKEAKENYLSLYNKDTPIDLSQNTVQALYGDLKFKVADSSTKLRFYPFIEQTIPAATKTELKAATATATATAVTTPAAAQSATATPAPATVQAKAGTAVQTVVKTAAPTPVKTAAESAAQGLLGFWGFYAVIGLVTTAYFLLRK